MISSSLSAMYIKPFQLVDSVVTNDIVPNSQHFTPSTSRKRRAGIQRIDLSKCSKKLLGGSNESLNGINISQNEADELQSPGNKDCPIVSNNGIKLEEGEESVKRLRLNSQSLFSASVPVGGANLLTSTEWHGSQEQLQCIGHPDSIKSNNNIKIQPNLSELEGSQWISGDESTSLRNAQLSSSGLVLKDELRGSKFELVGDGRNCKAVEINDQRNAVWHCQIIKWDEFRQVSEIMARMQEVAMDYSEEEFVVISNMLLPLEQIRIIHSPQRRGVVYMLLPDHHGTLHQLLGENELSCLNGGSTRLSEERAQPILKQVALLLDFCHKIGVYFRDFRLRKFVFTDNEKTQIRVNNVLDLYLAPKGKNELVISREFIPAYVAPERIDKKSEECDGKASDIWAFGVLIFTLLNGRYPFFESSRSPIALLRRIRAHRFSFPIHEEISESARWLIHSLLSPKPEDRPMANQILQAHWFRINRNSFACKAEYANPKRQNDIWEQSKTSSPPTTTFLLSSPGPVNSPSPTVGQVPSLRRLSPILIASQSQVSNNINELQTRHHGLIMTRPTLLQQQIIIFDSHIRTAISSRTTLLENGQQPAEHSEIGGRRRGRGPPAFVPINYAGPLTFSRGVGDDRQIIAHRHQLMMRLIPMNLTINNFEAASQFEEIFRKQQNENNDRLVPESTILSATSRN